MVNKSRGNYAYTMLDINGDVPTELVEKIQSNENIIKVRVITK